MALRILISIFVLLSSNLCYGQDKYLPIIRIYAENLSSSFSEAKIQIDEELEFPVDIRYRGASSINYSKKSFAIKLKDSEGNKAESSLLGMRSDNSWILDAMAIDKSRMRNRVSMDIWNDFSSDSYIKDYNSEAKNGTLGRFVEVYLNNEYWGVYCLSEKIDRKQLKLKKFKDLTVRGLLYKSYSWTTLYSNSTAYYAYVNNVATWNNWEVSYPDLEDGEPIDWAPLSQDIKWLSTASSDEVKEMLPQKIDMPVWQDYFLFMELICAEDNICKNQYVFYYDASTEDRKLGVAPWDMDHSWGRDYKGDITTKTAADFDLVTTHNNIQRVIRYKYYNSEDYVKERYSELRSSYFSEDSLVNRFKQYFDLYRESGAAKRETDRWNGVDGVMLDFEYEEEYISQWIHDRLIYMDTKYSYNPTCIKKGTSRKGSEGRIYDLAGRYVGNNPSSLPKGIYITNGKIVQKGGK